MSAKEKNEKRRVDGTPIEDTRNRHQKLFDVVYSEALATGKEKAPAIEIEGETCAKPPPKKKIVFSSNGKSMWYRREKEK